MRRDLVHLHVRPGTLQVSQGRTVLATDVDGCVAAGSEHGLIVHETRVLSLLRHLIDGEVPSAVALSNVQQHSWLGYYIRQTPGAPHHGDEGSGQVPDDAVDTLELRVSRFVGEGLHQDLDLENHALLPTRFELAVELDGDFADLVETDRERQQRGRIERRWRGAPQTSDGGEDAVPELLLDYRAEHAWEHQGRSGRAAIHRGLRMRVPRSDSPPHWRDGRLVFEVELPPRGRWHACLDFLACIDGEELPLQYGCGAFAPTGATYDRLRGLFLAESMRVEAGAGRELSASVAGTLEQARRDLAALRLFDHDRGARAWVPAAGLPLYVALYGRDTLTTAWQAASLGPEMLDGALQVMAAHQGAELDPWTDEEPGRMLHEEHTGPLEVLRFNPRRRSYGSSTTAGFFPVALASLWHWTGKRELVAPLLDAARKALRWRDTYGDPDGDGFYEYQTRSTQGVRHQAWKDSSDAVVDAEGRQVDPPIAACEEQAFAYLAKLHLSEVLWWLGDREEARALFRQAGDQRERFQRAFWMEEEAYVAMGLDAQKRPIRAIASNPGHCMAAGILEPEQVRAVADRMLAPELFSGWGVRTLSRDNPAYNPFSYHRGSVWPVEQATFCLGFLRYGLWEHLERLARAQFEAAELFAHHRLPEVFGGHQRDAEHPFPALYPHANSPQAWSASAVFAMLQALLGIYPYAPLRMLLVDPHLPEWLPEVTLRELRVGNAAVTLRFRRKANGASSHEVLDLRGELHVLRQPSPWSLTATYAERAKDALVSLLPGK